MPHTDVGVVSHRRHPRQSALGLAEGHNALFYLESQPAPLRLCYKNGPFVSSGPDVASGEPRQKHDRPGFLLQ